MDDRWASVARSLSQQDLKDTVMAMRERAVAFSRGSVRTFQRTLDRVERRQTAPEREVPALCRDLSRVHRIARGIERVAARTHELAREAPRDRAAVCS